MWGAQLTGEPERCEDLPVWVDLDVLFGPPPPDVEPSPGGRLRHALVLTGRVPGRLRLWGRSADGRRVGLVDYTVCDTSGATVVRHEHVVVPESALIQREPPPPRR